MRLGSCGISGENGNGRMLEQRKSELVLASLLRAAAAALAAFGLSASTLAADINVEPPEKTGDPAYITIDGEIKSGDDEKFRKIAAEYSKAVVRLNSGGGVIRPAMDIGRTIKLRGYATAIYKTDSCASACALIWLAGSKRFKFEGGEVGFHASYLDTDGTKLETGVGNALVGLYLSQLGFGEKTVIFATLAPPDKIFWLNENTASMSGIDFDTIPDDNKAEVPKVAVMQPSPPVIIMPPPAPAVPHQQSDNVSVNQPSDYEKFMGDAKQTLRSPEVFARALQEKGYQAKVSYDDPETPQISTGVDGEKIAIFFSSCDKEGCNYIQLIDFYDEISDVEKNMVITKASEEENYSHPINLKSANLFAFYNYIVIGTDGITAQTLIENMRYFVKSNSELLQVVTDMREKK